MSSTKIPSLKKIKPNTGVVCDRVPADAGGQAGEQPDVRYGPRRSKPGAAQASFRRIQHAPMRDHGEGTGRPADGSVSGWVGRGAAI